MDFWLKNKVALVVGATKNIGRAVAVELVNHGCKVVAVGRDRAQLDSLNTYASQSIDLMPREAVKRLTDWVHIKAGVPDIIVHAIGGSDGHVASWGESEEWEKVWRLNLGIPHDINREFISGMVKKRYGRIVHFSSVSVTAHNGYAPYASAKHAVEGYVQRMSREVSKNGVIMTCVRPGSFPVKGRGLGLLDDEQRNEYFDRYLPINRFGEVLEIAKLVAFLCSDHASYMPGSIIPIDGGHR